MSARGRSGPGRSGRLRPPSQRQLRVGETVRHALSSILERDAIHDPDLAGTSITVTEVAMSPDLRIATAHVTPLGGGDGGRIVGALNRAAPAIRRLLAPTNTLKFLPALRFALDTRFDHAERIAALLARARAGRPGAGPDGSDDP